jgi:DNA-binding NtrC family response regulator
MERCAVQAGGRAIAAEQIEADLVSATTQGQPNLESLLHLPFHESVAQWERRLISNAMEAAKGNKAEAARRLGIHRRLLYEKLSQFGMH